MDYSNPSSTDGDPFALVVFTGFDISVFNQVTQHWAAMEGESGSKMKCKDIDRAGSLAKPTGAEGHPRGAYSRQQLNCYMSHWYPVHKEFYTTLAKNTEVYDQFDEKTSMVMLIQFQSPPG